MKYNIQRIFVFINRFYLNRPDPFLSKITQPGSDLNFFYPTQHQAILMTLEVFINV